MSRPYVTPTPAAIDNQAVEENLGAVVLLMMLPQVATLVALIGTIWALDWRWVATTLVLAAVAASFNFKVRSRITARIEELRTEAGLDNTRKGKS